MTQESQCCPKFDPAYYDGKTHHWNKKNFVKADVIQFMHMPLNMGPVIGKTWKIIDEAKAAPADKDFLILMYDPSPWKSELYFTTTKEIPDANNVTLSGEFYSKVFDGPYQDVPKWYKAMEDWAKENKKKIVKQYFHYAYCPKCSKKYGHNYCVAFAQLEK
jgi:hypothetical protein